MFVVIFICGNLFLRFSEKIAKIRTRKTFVPYGIRSPKYDWRGHFGHHIYNPGKNVGTLRVSGEENIIQVNPLPPEQCWVLQVKHLSHFLQTLMTSTMFRGGGGFVKAMFMSVYCRLAASSIQKHVKRGVPKPFNQDCSGIGKTLVRALTK